MKSAMFSRIMMSLGVVCLLAAGCSKIKHSSNYTSTNVTQPPKGGLGGHAVINITPDHNDILVDSCLIYIKYDSPVVPFDNQYDDSVWCVDMDGTPVAKFVGLKPGDYYFFARGWDLIRSEKVRGGLPFTVTDTNARTVHHFILPVRMYE